MKNIQDALKETQMVHRDDNLSLHWSMLASSGRSRFDCAFIMRSQKSDSLVCALGISSAFWKRGIVDNGAEIVNDINVELPQVLLDFKAIQIFCAKLNEWLQNGNQFAIDLGATTEGDQKLRIGLEIDENLLCTTLKPAFTIHYSSGSVMQARWSFLVDQSCIRICAEEIQNALESMFNSSKI